MNQTGPVQQSPITHLPSSTANQTSHVVQNDKR